MGSFGKHVHRVKRGLITDRYPVIKEHLLVKACFLIFINPTLDIFECLENINNIWTKSPSFYGSISGGVLYITRTAVYQSWTFSIPFDEKFLVSGGKWSADGLLIYATNAYFASFLYLNGSFF